MRLTSSTQLTRSVTQLTRSVTHLTRSRTQLTRSVRQLTHSANQPDGTANDWSSQVSVMSMFSLCMSEFFPSIFYVCVRVFLVIYFLLVSYIAKEVIPPYSFVSTLVLYSVFITLFCRYYFVSLWVLLNTIRHKLRTFSPVHLLLSTVVFYIFPYRFNLSFLFFSYLSLLYYFYVFSS